MPVAGSHFFTFKKHRIPFASLVHSCSVLPVHSSKIKLHSKVVFKNAHTLDSVLRHRDVPLHWSLRKWTFSTFVYLCRLCRRQQLRRDHNVRVESNLEYSWDRSSSSFCKLKRTGNWVVDVKVVQTCVVGKQRRGIAARLLCRRLIVTVSTVNVHYTVDSDGRMTETRHSRAFKWCPITRIWFFFNIQRLPWVCAHVVH